MFSCLYFALLFDYLGGQGKSLPFDLKIKLCIQHQSQAERSPAAAAYGCQEESARWISAVNLHGSWQVLKDWGGPMRSCRGILTTCRYADDFHALPDLFPSPVARRKAVVEAQELVRCYVKRFLVFGHFRTGSKLITTNGIFTWFLQGLGTTT